jgi:hypothetical protein
MRINPPLGGQGGKPETGTWNFKRTELNKIQNEINIKDMAAEKCSSQGQV